MENARIDKYLWCIRAFKTRSEATDACKGNKVSVNGNVVKPAKELRAGDLIRVRKGAVEFSWRVLGFPKSRVGASLVPDYAQDLTPPEEREKLHAPVESFFVTRERGSGRPTKKERRIIDALWDSFDAED
ncbi:MAG: RNA-binding S4 domain-containing protein [Bacteroidales bacterium]|nr:RNA-binding S4 domain-containing protein [Bacteroidales bacterium]